MRPALSRAWPWTWRTALVVVVAVGGLWTAMHGVAGVRWHDVLAVLMGVTAWRLVALAGIWLTGLGIYSVVLSTALPGLGVRRSLVLNLSGSAVANVVPLGGAAATALNWRMVRSWGHSDAAFVAFCVLTNVLDVLAKLLLPVIAVAVLVTLSLHVPVLLWVAAGGCAVVLALGWLVRTLLRRSRRGAGDPDPRWQGPVRRYLRDSGERIGSLLEAGWPRLLPASVAYVAAQVVLLFFSLRFVGLDATVVVVLVAAAIERLGTLLPVTPGGTGVAEIGAIAWLVAAGLDPVEVVAGVLLYRVFLIVLEVPVGGLLLGRWVWARRTAARADLVRPVPAPEQHAA